MTTQRLRPSKQEVRKAFWVRWPRDLSEERLMFLNTMYLQFFQLLVDGCEVLSLVNVGQLTLQLA